VASLQLPRPPAGQTVFYTITASSTFQFDGLINPNTGSISGPEESQVSLDAPIQIPFTGQSRTALFSVTFDGFNNVFRMSFASLT
jgi:hypothetical protein